MRQLLGNQRLLAQLSAAVQENRLAHAYLLCGGQGSGKKTLAEIFAHMILCSDGGCGKCTVCGKIEQNIHPDVIWVSGVNKNGAYSVDQIRALRREAMVYPNEGNKKIYILKEAEKLTQDAQDAFLKILEEPPHFVVFLLLCSDDSKLRATILSRVVRLPMETPSTKESLAWLKAQAEGTEELLRTALAVSGGNPGQALELISRGTLQQHAEQCEQFCTILTEGAAYQLSAFCHKLAADKAQFAAFLRMLCLYLRDILIYKSVGSEEHLIFGDRVVRHRQAYMRLHTRNLPDVIEQIEDLAACATRPISMLLIEMRLVTTVLERLIR